ncbi:suppressor protein SRP40 [Iris pallida]|nr:suppressor protein SRP40 [Iris pallida]
MINSGSGDGKIAVSEENTEKKTHRKRKKAPEDGAGALADNETAVKVSKRAKVAGDEDNKERGTLPQSTKPDGELATIDKRKIEKSSEKSNRTGAASPKEQESNSQDIQKGSGQQDVNCNLEKEKEKGASAKSMKKEKRSAEPKTINAFQRVKVDEVKFADERLQDNSYWALDKSGSGYGAKAQEVLGQVRGRDFRHEKTKKKRGSYRGGQIDFESKSIKFDSDGE